MFHRQCDLISQLQKEEITDWTDLVRLTDNYVKRTDRTLPHLRSDDSLNLALPREKRLKTAADTYFLPYNAQHNG
jgi:hypothetical protein